MNKKNKNIMRLNINKTGRMVMLFALLAFFGCSEENGINDPKFIGSIPAPVTDYTVESTYGGSIITFKMPASDDLLYVKAVYTLASGLTREAKSSLYKNFIIVDGFEKEGEYNVELYAVAKGEVSSEATMVKIQALTPPYLLTRNSLNLVETFGGVNVSFENLAAANLSITLLEKDSTNTWNEKYTHYFNSQKSDFSVRGYESEPKDFAVFVKDRWSNLSDTLVKTCTPQFEELIDKKLWKKYELPGDHTLPHPSYQMWKLENIWNEAYTGHGHFHTALFIDKYPTPHNHKLHKRYYLYAHM